MSRGPAIPANSFLLPSGKISVAAGVSPAERIRLQAVARERGTVAADTAVSTAVVARVSRASCLDQRFEACDVCHAKVAWTLATWIL
jgi:hypothetical protein